MEDQWGFCSTIFFFFFGAFIKVTVLREKKKRENQGDGMAVERWGKALRGLDFQTYSCTWCCCCIDPSYPTEEHPDPDWPFGGQLGGGLCSGACKGPSAKMLKKESEEKQDFESPVTCFGNKSGSEESHILSLCLRLTPCLRCFQLQNLKLCQVLLKPEFRWIMNLELLFLDK